MIDEMKSYIIAVIVLLILVNSVKADLSNPGVTPNSFFYFLDQMFDFMAEDEDLADEKMAEAIAMAKIDHQRGFSKAILAYKEVLVKLEAKSRLSETDAEKISKQVSEHLAALMLVREIVPKEAKVIVNDAIQRSNIGFNIAVGELKKTKPEQAASLAAQVTKTLEVRELEIAPKEEPDHLAGLPPDPLLESNPMVVEKVSVENDTLKNVTEEVSETDECEEISAVSAKEKCIKDLALSNQDSAICEKLKIPKSTFNSVEVACYTDIALATSNNSICATLVSVKVSTDELRFNCYKTYAITNNATALCNDITDQTQKEDCTRRVEVRINHSTLGIANIIDKSWYSIAKTSNDQKYCQYIISIFDRRDCEEFFS
jgi:hypothetical protein